MSLRTSEARRAEVASTRSEAQCAIEGRGAAGGARTRPKGVRSAGTPPRRRRGRCEDTEHRAAKGGTVRRCGLTMPHCGTVSRRSRDGGIGNPSVSSADSSPLEKGEPLGAAVTEGLTKGRAPYHSWNTKRPFSHTHTPPKPARFNASTAQSKCRATFSTRCASALMVIFPPARRMYSNSRGAG